MKKIYLSVILLAVFSYAIAQPTQPNNPAVLNCAATPVCTNVIAGNPWDACSGGAVAFASSFSGSSAPVLFSGTALQPGAVYRCTNIGVHPVSGILINATITIDAASNAVLTTVDDNTAAAVDENGGSVVPNLSPRIQPDVTLNATRRGYVQFTIRFYVGSGAGAGFTTPATIPNPSMIHYDNDGNGNVNQWFRETGVTQRLSPTNPAVVAIAGPSPTELGAYNYNHAGSDWIGFAGSVCERSGISRCAEVAETYKFSTAESVLTFRLGYDFKYNGTGGGLPNRQYAIRFACSGPVTASLPLTITSFSLNYKDGKAGLYWRTVDERNFSHFEIERSVNGRDFVEIDRVTGKGVGAVSSDYSYTDDIRLVQAASLFYRLKMIDADGTYTYSNVASLRRGAINSKLSISPNPASSMASVRFSAERGGTGNLIVTDAIGRNVFQKNLQFMSGDNTVTLPEISSLKNGLYYVKLIFGDEVIQDRLVIRK